METLKEFFKNVNYRLSSPFIFSFVVSWLICNWQIPIAIFFYNNELLKTEGSLHYIALVTKYLNWFHALLFPFVAALFYTFAYPYINKWIKDYQTTVEVKAEESEIEIRKGSSIPMDKYLTLRDSVVKKEKKLDEIIKQESSTRDQLSAKQDELHTVQIRNAELVDEANKAREVIADYNNLKKEYIQPETLAEFFKGTWVCEYNIVSPKDDRDHEIGFEPFYINKTEYLEKGAVKFSIQHIRYVPFLNTLTFHKNSLVERDSVIVVTITRVNEILWCGIEKLPTGITSHVRYYPKDKRPPYFQFNISEASLEGMGSITDYRARILKGIEFLKK